MSTPFVLKLPSVSKDCCAITRSLEVLFRDNVLNRLINSDMMAKPRCFLHLPGLGICEFLLIWVLGESGLESVINVVLGQKASGSETLSKLQGSQGD